MILTRRDFTRLASTAAVASTLAPRLDAQGTPRKIRYCIVGLGGISLQHFMPATKMSSISEVTALVSGHPDKAAKSAIEYNVPESSIYSYETFDKIRDNPNIDAVYIALPNSMHAEYTIRAAKAGKHVLCEKPMATSVADSKAMIAACAKADRKLMIAYRCHFEPTNLHAIQLIRSGALGQVQSIVSTNGFKIGPGQWRCNRALAGGGPLMDMGVYSLNACRYLTGEEPVPASISAVSSVIDHDGRFDTVEENGSWAMKFPSGITAACSTTYGANMEGYYKVFGSKGWLQLSPAFAYEGIHMTAHMPGAERGAPGTNIDETEKDRDPSQFLVQADYFSNCVLNNKTPEPSGEEGLRDMQYMQQIYHAAGLPLLNT